MDLLTGFSRLLRWRNLTKNQSILTDGSRRLALAKKPMDMDSPPVPGTENRTIKPPTQLWGKYFCRTLSDVPETNMGSHGPKITRSSSPLLALSMPDHAAAGPRSLTNRIDGFYDRRLQRSNLGKPVKKSIDSDRRTSRTSRGMDVDEIEK
jgi:hypothetical protein